MHSHLAELFVYGMMGRFGLTMKKVAILLLFFLFTINAQDRDIIWEENFNNLDNWMKVTGNGSWGWGNGELEF